MLRKLLPIVLFVAAFAVTCWAGVGSQTCGNVYNDVSDKRAAILAGDTVRSGVVGDTVLRADSGRAYAWTCTKHFGSQNLTFMIIGILGVLLALYLFWRAMRREEQVATRGYITCGKCGKTTTATARVCPSCGAAL